MLRLLSGSRFGRASGFNVATTGMKWTQEGMPHEKIIIVLPLFGRSYLSSRNLRKRVGAPESLELASQLKETPLSLNSRGFPGLRSYTSELKTESAADLERHLTARSTSDAKPSTFNDAAYTLGSYTPASMSLQMPSQAASSSPIALDLRPDLRLMANNEILESDEEGNIRVDVAPMKSGTDFSETGESPKDVPEYTNEVAHQPYFGERLAATIGSFSSGPGMDGGFVPYGKASRKQTSLQLKCWLSEGHSCADNRNSFSQRFVRWCRTEP